MKHFCFFAETIWICLYFSVYCQGTGWGPWQKGPCSATCGPGERTATRECLNLNLCVGDLRKRVERCRGQCTSGWSNWVRTSRCSVTCGTGEMTEERSCVGTNNCPGERQRQKICTKNPCAAWSQWSIGQCDVTCGQGKRRDTRACTGGGNCPGTNFRDQVCNAGRCSEWESWVCNGRCSTTCGNGVQICTRRCRYGNDCPGKNTRSKQCQISRTCTCDVNADWSNWEPIGPCSVACGQGEQPETRKCIGRNRIIRTEPRTSSCIGTTCCRDTISDCTRHQQLCRNELWKDYLKTRCPGTCRSLCTNQPTGEWSEWINGRCSVSCGTGRASDVRYCINGNNCVGSRTRSRDCIKEQCTTYGPWINIGPCSVSCGLGQIFQRRYCLSGPCSNLRRTATCGGGICPVYGPWKSYGSCSATCGWGQISQRRVCISGTCTILFRTIRCSLRDCPVPTNQIGQWNQWVPWNQCSNGCGKGIQIRSRSCSNVHCDGVENTQLKTCLNTICSPISGAWGEWTAWGACSRSCGPGIQLRTRKCSKLPCEGGINRITRSCNNQDCQEINICSRSCGNGTRYNSEDDTYVDCNEGICESQECPPKWNNRFGFRSHECCDDSHSKEQICGMPAQTTIRERVIGGRETSITKWPWMVQIYVNDAFHCGGSLVSKDYVVTAAHCINEVDSSAVTLNIGVEKLQPALHNRSAVNIIVHNRFNATGILEYDVAIIKLNASVDLGFVTARALCLPGFEAVPIDLECVIAGWGLVSNVDTKRDPLQHLLAAEVRILPPKICRRAYTKYFDPSRQLCAGRIDGSVDACTGDSGGPLMCQRCSSCQWMLTGIVSFGGLCATANQPGVYTLVESVERWIYDNIRDLNPPVNAMPSCI